MGTVSRMVGLVEAQIQLDYDKLPLATLTLSLFP